MYFLSLCKGPVISKWANDHVVETRNKVTRTQNPIGRDEEVLWTDVRNAFIAAWTDTNKAENAYTALQQLKMYKNDLDGYIVEFNHLAHDAGYDTNNLATINIFAHGIEPWLL